MLKRIKHITALLLMVVVPISAIGLNISVHKCKLTGVLECSLLGFSAQKHKADCCCKNSNSETKEKAIASCCSAKSDEKKTEQSEQMSCCNPQNDVVSETDDNDNQPLAQSGINFSKAPCCSNISEALVVDSPSNLDENAKSLNDIFTLSLKIYFKLDFIPTESDLSSVTESEHPLKVPINCIISYIHQSNNSREDGGASNSGYLMLS